MGRFTSIYVIITGVSKLFNLQVVAKAVVLIAELYYLSKTLCNYKLQFNSIFIDFGRGIMKCNSEFDVRVYSSL